MYKRISIYTMDKALLFKLITKGLFPMSVTVTVNGVESGKELNYFEDEQGMILGTTNIPEPPVLIHLYVTATKPIPKYPYGAQYPAAIVGEAGPELIIPKVDQTKAPNVFRFELNNAGESFHDALSKFSYPVINLNITPAMIETTLENMDSDCVKGCLDEWVKKEWYEYAAVAKKILDQRI